MKIYSQVLRLVAKKITATELSKSKKARQNQEKIFKSIVKKARQTSFGKDHRFESIYTYADFKSQVPVKDYEALRPYFERIKSGEINVLWPGKPKYFAKTSGTTSGAKYIPITKESISNHIDSARNALFAYVSKNQNSDTFQGKMLFLSGSPELENLNGVLTGRLSGIVNHEIPVWFQKNKLPDWEVNCEPKWDVKVDKMIAQILPTDLRVISGIPPWIQMLLERILEITNAKSISEVFPNLELYIHGGVNYKPYENRIQQLIGKPVQLLETYPASEGFFAYQNDMNDEGLLLNTSSGIFYEFIALRDFSLNQPPRLCLQEVELHQDYAIVISSNAGLWAYSIGDVVRFTSLQPYKIRVTGRVSQYISAFGEHVIASEIDEAITEAQKKFGFQITEYCVAPQVNPSDQQLPYHEWYIEFKDVNISIPLDVIAEFIDSSLQKKNSYYKDLIENKILDKLKIRRIKKDGFKTYLISVNKYGEQFKVPRLNNDRMVAQSMSNFVI